MHGDDPFAIVYRRRLHIPPSLVEQDAETNLLSV